MEQLSIRDWMILIGGMMIVAVLIDAVRRYWRERRAELKLNARIERAAPLSNDDDAFNLLTELPNGGARIVHRDDLQGIALIPGEHLPCGGSATQPPTCTTEAPTRSTTRSCCTAAKRSGHAMRSPCCSSTTGTR